jgi:hypothetical protein
LRVAGSHHAERHGQLAVDDEHGAIVAVPVCGREGSVPTAATTTTRSNARRPDHPLSTVVGGAEDSDELLPCKEFVPTRNTLMCPHNHLQVWHPSVRGTTPHQRRRAPHPMRAHVLLDFRKRSTWSGPN